MIHILKYIMIIITYPTLTLVVTFYISHNISVHAMYTLKITSRYPRMYISNILILVIIDHDPILVLHTLEKNNSSYPPPLFFFNIWVGRCLGTRTKFKLNYFDQQHFYELCSSSEIRICWFNIDEKINFFSMV